MGSPPPVITRLNRAASLLRQVGDLATQSHAQQQARGQFVQQLQHRFTLAAVAAGRWQR
jgi:hypothetical protein